MTPGSWWQNPHRGGRLVVARYPTIFMGHWSKGHSYYVGEGQPRGRLPAYQEGRQLNLVWLYPEELRAGWIRYRPSSKDAIPVPSWVSHPKDGFNDFMLDGELHVGVIGIRGGMLALSGMDPEPVKWDGYGSCRYTTLFISTGEARARLVPKFSKLQRTAWDHLATHE